MVPSVEQVPIAGTEIEVELFGVPRLLVGQRSLAVAGTTLRELAAGLATRGAPLVGPVIDPATGWLVDGYIFVVDEVFTRDPSRVLSPASTVFLVSSVAGG
jgi:molybdopterin converting factor small subunit